MRKRILKIYGCILALGIPYLIWLLLTGIRIPCLFYEATGYPCPAFGTTRMFLSLARLDLRAAFGWNPPMLVFLFLWNAVALGCWIGKPRWCSSPRFLYTLLGITAGTLFLFGLLRILG